MMAKHKATLRERSMKVGDSFYADLDCLAINRSVQLTVAKFLRIAYEKGFRDGQRAAKKRGSNHLSRTDLPDAVKEIKRLRKKVHEWEESDKAASVLGPMFTEEIQRLREENAALREDKERLDWLSNQEAPSIFQAGMGCLWNIHVGNIHCQSSFLRLAIDAAKETK